MINIFLERDCLSGILLGKVSTTFFCKELHSKYFGFCKSRGKIKALQGYVGTCTRTIKNGKAILGLQAGRNQAATPICLQILLLGEACAYITFITVWFVVRAEAPDEIHSSMVWPPRPHDLWPMTSPAGLSLPRPPHSPRPCPPPCGTSVWCSASFSALALALSSAWNILFPTPSGVAGCFSNFRSWFQGSHLREAFSGTWATPPTLHIPAGIPAWNGVFICLVVFPPLSSLFHVRNCLIYLPLYPYIKNKKVLNLVSNFYSNCLKFSFTRLN